MNQQMKLCLRTNLLKKKLGNRMNYMPKKLHPLTILTKELNHLLKNLKLRTLLLRKKRSNRMDYMLKRLNLRVKTSSLSRLMKSQRRNLLRRKTLLMPMHT